MNTLIVYASKHGSAKKCSSILKDKLKGEVSVINIKNQVVPDIKLFDNIIIGCSVYAGRIQKEISKFASKNIEVLLNKKVGIFICGMSEEGVESEFNNSFPKELLESAAAKEFFGGEFNFTDMNFFEKIIIKMVSKASSKKEDNNSKIDMKQDISMIKLENINKLAQTMNK